MSAIPFLNKLQIGSKTRSRPSLNLDNVISRLVCHKKDIFTVQGEEIEVPPFACKFRKDAQSDLLAVCNEDGDILLYDTLKKEALIKTFSAHHNAIFDICWVPDKCHLISGSGDHLAILWDISTCKSISVFRQHIASIKSVDVCREQSAVFATGSRDGNINVWDTRVNLTSGYLKPVISIFQAHGRKNTIYKGKKSVQKDPVSSVSAVSFQDSNNLASAGVADGIVKIWDLRRTYVLNSKYQPSPRYKMDYSESGHTGHGCTSLVFDSQYKTLYACSTSHKILKFDCHSYVKEAVAYEGFQCSTYFVKLDLSSDDQYLLCGSSDEKAYVWKTSKPGLPIIQLASHSAEVTSVTWSPYDVTKLATCGDDSKVIIWRISDTENVSINENIHAVAEPYCESPKNGSSSLFQDIAQNSIIASRPSDKKSPVLSSRTPSKPAVRVITNFFSPLTPPVQTFTTYNQNQIDVNGNNSSNPISKSPNKNLAGDLPSTVLTPYNHVNKNSNTHQTPEDNSVVQTSPELKGIGSGLSNPSTFVKNKENTDVSPESAFKANTTLQPPRKVASKHSTPAGKRKRTESSKRSKGFVKENKKTVTGKTIMNYFSVILCTDKSE